MSSPVAFSLLAATPPMRVSVIVPCRDEERFIGPCLDSILASAYPPELIEVLVVDGRSEDRTRDIVQEYSERNPIIRLLDNPDRIVSAALNRAIGVATGEIVARMDAHAIYPPEYLPRLVAALAATGADNVGGRLVVLPANRGAAARGIALALMHPLGVGNAWFRLGSHQRRWVDTVPYGCYRREVFDRMGLFDEELVRNQDDEFNHRLIRRGGRILLLPDVVSAYFARPSLRALSRTYYQYGYFKPFAARKIGRVMTIRQLVPSAFLSVLAGLGIPALIWKPAAVLLSLVAGTYFAAVATCALRTLPRHGARCALTLALAFVVMHTSYGFGFLRGLWRSVRPGGRRLDPAAVRLSR